MAGDCVCECSLAGWRLEGSSPDVGLGGAALLGEPLLCDAARLIVNAREAATECINECVTSRGQHTVGHIARVCDIFCMEVVSCMMFEDEMLLFVKAG